MLLLLELCLLLNVLLDLLVQAFCLLRVLLLESLHLCLLLLPHLVLNRLHFLLLGLELGLCLDLRAVEVALGIEQLSFD